MVISDYLKYDETTGMFMRLQSKHKRYEGYWFGGNPTSNGYLEVMCNGVKHPAHRLAWYLSHGDWVTFLDHINGDKSDNKLSNLRPSSPSENQKNRKFSVNNTSGEVGITVTPSGKFRVRIRLNCLLNDLGIYYNIDDAITVRDAFYKENGFDPNHGKRGKYEVQS
jgi:hypothetical protein